jgi:hypothetical protein
MRSEILFEEIQGSGKKQLRDFLRVLIFGFTISIAINLYRQHGEITMWTTGLLTGLVFSGIASLLTYVKMITQIRTDGIYVRFPPFQSSFSRYEWGNILDIYIREFDAIPEYGGWGIRFSPMGRGFILPGHTGIQIVLQDKSRILISTRMPEEVAEVLKRMGF